MPVLGPRTVSLPFFPSFFFVLVFVVQSTTVYGQNVDYTFEHLEFPGGSNANIVTDVVQDAEGFMWFSTWQGAHRYDGYTFTTFVHDPVDSTSISANWVETLLIDREETLWLGTYGGGLNRFDAETETFTHFQRDPDYPASISQDSVTVLLEDHDGVLWVGTFGGLNRFDRERERFEHFRYDPADPTSISDDQVRALYEDRQGTLWVGTRSPFPGEDEVAPGPGGLSRFNRDTKDFTNYRHDPNNPASLIDNHVRAIHEDSDGTFWVGTSGDGLHTMDRQAGTFVRHETDYSDPGKLSRPYDRASGNAQSGGITFIFEDSRGDVWMGSFGSAGLLRYNPATGNLTRVDLSSWGELEIWDMYESSEGTLWIATLGGGVRLARRTEDIIQATRYENGSNLGGALAFDRAGNLWAATQTSSTNLSNSIRVLAYGLSNDSFTRQRLIDLNLATSDTPAVLKPRASGGLWIGTFRGTPAAPNGELYLIDAEFGPVVSVVPENRSRQMGPVTAIHDGEGDGLWFGTKWTGLYHLDRETGAITQYAFDPDGDGGLSHPSVTVIYESPSEPGVLLIGTEHGLNRFDKQTERFTGFQVSPDDVHGLRSHISSVFEDSTGRIWIGTVGGGLRLLNRETEEISLFTPYNSGLPDQNVFCLLGDDNGKLWMSTGLGISRFDPERRRFYSYTGQAVRSVGGFIKASCSRSPNGQLVFGGNSGFSTVIPERYMLETDSFRVVVSTFTLEHNPVRPGPEGPIGRPIWQTERITLDHDQNTVSFQASALDYEDSGANQYAFFLEGYDENWSETGTQRSVSYAKVPSGAYTLRVRAANSRGTWVESNTPIHLTVRPPWWRTTWAHLAYGILFICGIFAADRTMRRRLIRRERERSREVELKQAREIEKAYGELKATQQQLVQSEKMASLGHMASGIAHEMQNPLNFVNNFALLSSELATELADEATDNADEPFGTYRDEIVGLKTNVDRIARHGKRAEDIVKNMMAHAQMGSQDRYEVGLNNFVDEYVGIAYNGILKRLPNLDVDIAKQFDSESGVVKMAPQEVGRAIVNILNNAFEVLHEYDPSGDGSFQPVVRVTTRREPGAVKIMIGDNGPGIPEGVQERVFEPFFTTKPTGSGTGLGLSLAYEIIVDGHNGSLQVEREEDGGATFVVTLPSGNS